MKNTILRFALGCAVVAAFGVETVSAAEPTRDAQTATAGCASIRLATNPSVQDVYPNLPVTITWELIFSLPVDPIPPFVLCQDPAIRTQNVTVNWGDGGSTESIESSAAGTTVTLSHEFTEEGPAKVLVSGQVLLRSNQVVNFNLSYDVFLGFSPAPQVTTIDPLPGISTSGMDWNARLYDNRTKLLFLTDEFGYNEIREADVASDGAITSPRPFPLPLPPGAAVHAFDITADGSKLLARVAANGVSNSFILVDREADPPTTHAVQVPGFPKGYKSGFSIGGDSWLLPRALGFSADEARLLVMGFSEGEEGPAFNGLLTSHAAATDNPYRYIVERQNVFPDEFERLTTLNGAIRFYTAIPAGRNPTIGKLYSTNQAGPLPGAYFANRAAQDLPQNENPAFTSWIGANDYELGALSADGTFLIFSTNKEPSLGEYDLYIAHINPFPNATDALLGTTKPDAILDANSDGVIDAADVVTP